MKTAFEETGVDPESGSVLGPTRLRVEGHKDARVIVKEYQEDADNCNEEAESSSK